MAGGGGSTRQAGTEELKFAKLSVVWKKRVQNVMEEMRCSFAKFPGVWKKRNVRLRNCLVFGRNAFVCVK